jgi:hypothetical protein
VLTIFTIPKPFDGHIGMIQRNAIGSWKRLRPKPEIILFGEEAGVAGAAEELGVEHVAEIARNEFGTPLLDDVFAQAQRAARYDWLCYSNTDMILFQDFVAALERLAGWRDRFLMVGRRWNVDLLEPCDFSAPDWDERLRRHALERGHRAQETYMDYFVFRRGFYRDIPPFAVGRPGWDPWMIWKALESGAPVVDVSPAILAIHQNHDFAHYAGGWDALVRGPEAQQNLNMAPASRRRTLASATHRLAPAGIEPNRFRWLAGSLDGVRYAQHLWYRLLVWSKPFRYRVGLHRSRRVARAD